MVLLLSVAGRLVECGTVTKYTGSVFGWELLLSVLGG